jgi:hypothetical protein
MSLAIYKRFESYWVEKSPLAVTVYRNRVIYMLS